MDDEANFGVEKNWKHANGIVASRGETNSAFAARNYEVKCRTTGAVIAVIGGYHLWWCNLHHQPLAWCDKARAEEQARADEREKMRELKFRAWDAKKNEMEYFGLFDEWSIANDGLRMEPVPVMQYTGFKDRTGKEIYEGDIVKRTDGKTGIVSFSQDGVMVKVGDEWLHHHDVSLEKIEVVSNTYELHAAIEKLGMALQDIAEKQMQALEPLMRELVKIAKENPGILEGNHGTD